MHETPSDPGTNLAPSGTHFHLAEQHVVIPLDYFLRLVDAAARARYAPQPLPSTVAAQEKSPVDRIAGGTMRSPSLNVPGSEWQPQGLAAGEKKT